MKLFMILDFDSSLFGFFAYEILFPCGAKRKKITYHRVSALKGARVVPSAICLSGDKFI